MFPLLWECHHSCPPAWSFQTWIFLWANDCNFVWRHWMETMSRWLFQIFFHFHPYLGRWFNLTNIFKMGWNHQPDIFGPKDSNPKIGNPSLLSWLVTAKHLWQWGQWRWSRLFDQGGLAGIERVIRKHEEKADYRCYAPEFTNMTGWKMPIFYRKYIFKSWTFHCDVSFQGVLAPAT